MTETAKNIKLVIEYKGTSFCGWQIQKGQPTVQEEITSAIESVTSQRVNVIGAGRTDAGVHALGQTANFMIRHSLEPERYRDALNFYLPDDIRVKSSEEVDEKFHSRFSAVYRRYRYLVGLERSALYREFRYEVERRFDPARLKEAALRVLGEHDFSPFCVVASRQENNFCTIYQSRWYRIGPLLVYEVRGNRFLHSMVRSLVGAMLNLSDEDPDDHPANLTLDSFTDILLTPSGLRIPFTAPPHGLYLVSVGY
jgi:tRNA pseudouridine38-40 synthase